MSEIRAVLFDFGGVVVDAPFAAFEAVERRHGLPVGIIREINSRNPDTNAWAQLERASIDVESFIALFEAEAHALGVNLAARDVLAALSSTGATVEAARPVILGAIAELRARRIRVGLLTNNITPIEARPGHDWVLRVFDTVVESCRVGLRKPDEQIYLAACAALGSGPEQTAFLDDLGINLKPARRLGMHTIKVIDPTVAVQELLDAVRRSAPAATRPAAGEAS